MTTRLHGRRQIRFCVGVRPDRTGKLGREDTGKRTRKLLRVTDMFVFLIVLMVLLEYAYIKPYWILYCNYMQVIYGYFLSI